jgi:hypothetical protein
MRQALQLQPWQLHVVDLLQQQVQEQQVACRGSCINRAGS